ncbi:MAG: hypothetical protein HYU74_12530 [Dechloromonas sp.]|nr:hypothetical protein [Dechloromonas sp.]
MKPLKWALISILITGLMIAGFAYDVPGARNIITAYVWVGLVLSVFCQSEASIEAFRKAGRTVPESVSWLMFVLRFCFLAWFGEFLLCAVYFTSQILFHSVLHRAFDKKEAV